ncbi:hypothetical protein PENTCL1PPCAC_10873 [Pristionchus entomophagus]|uniref:Uncharacterized protein n=1 Tax=Pristionchus entomophagus TaxID=358040 RepID=A0AAV5T050_9BILA|nr:hypothetical protein PENTCL1PPCAC_10873 [Pristionchus entomophagus]
MGDRSTPSPPVIFFCPSLYFLISHEAISTSSNEKETKKKPAKKGAKGKRKAPLRDIKASTSEVNDTQHSELLRNCGLDLSFEHERVRQLRDILTKQLKKCETCSNQLICSVLSSPKLVIVTDPLHVYAQEVARDLSVFFVCETCKWVSATGHSIDLYDLDLRSIAIINYLLFPNAGLTIPPLNCCYLDVLDPNNNATTVCTCFTNRLAIVSR